MSWDLPSNNKDAWVSVGNQAYRNEEQNVQEIIQRHVVTGEGSPKRHRDFSGGQKSTVTNNECVVADVRFEVPASENSGDPKHFQLYDEDTTGTPIDEWTASGTSGKGLTISYDYGTNPIHFPNGMVMAVSDADGSFSTSSSTVAMNFLASYQD